jgi:hypothetical protein
MFRHRTQLRRIAAQVLLLWLFGIGAGLANACFAAGAAEPLGHCDAMRAAEAVHHQGTSGHDGAPAKTNCQDFCEKSTISIPPLKLALDHADAGAISFPTVAVLLIPAASEPAERWVPRPDGGLAPPITIAFLRLAL